MTAASTGGLPTSAFLRRWWVRSAWCATAPRLWARLRAQIHIPEDALYLTLVHVETASQGEGIGTCLLEWADREANRLGARRMCLTTTLDNPALKLYERNGYVVTRTADDPVYVRRLGVPGRVLMEKQLVA